MTGATKKVYVTSFHVAYIRGDSRYTSYFKKMSTDLKKIEKKTHLHLLHDDEREANKPFYSYN